MAQAAHFQAKSSRFDLADALRDVDANMAITRRTRRKAALVAMLEQLLRLQGVADLRIAIR